MKAVEASATADLDQLTSHVEQATAWAQNCYPAYVESGTRGRRRMNQAFFKRVWVTEKASSAGSTTSPSPP